MLDKIKNQKKGLPESVKEVIQELLDKVKPEISELNSKLPVLLVKINKEYENIIIQKNTKILKDYKEVDKIKNMIDNDIKIKINNKNINNI